MFLAFVFQLSIPLPHLLASDIRESGWACDMVVRSQVFEVDDRDYRLRRGKHTAEGDSGGSYSTFVV
jgi:hypothetical protein